MPGVPERGRGRAPEDDALDLEGARAPIHDQDGPMTWAAPVPWSGEAARPPLVRMAA